MTSLIDTSKPIYGTPTTQSVRDNFTTAQSEISELQDERTPNWPYLPLGGGIMNGKISLDADPISALHAATKQYVDNLAFSQSGGTPEAPKDGMSYARGGASTPTDFNNWMSSPVFNEVVIAQNATTQLFRVTSDATYNIYGLALTGVDKLQYHRVNKLLQFLFNGNSIADFSATGINFNQPVTVVADPTTNLGVATKQYVDTKVTSGAASITVSDTPPATPNANALWWDSVGTQLYLWYNDGNTTQWVNATNAGFGALNSDAPVDGETYGRNNGIWANIGAEPTVQNNIGRNLIHNPLFIINQRASGVITVAAGYPVDRWVTSFLGDTVSYAQTIIGSVFWAAEGDESIAYGLQTVFTGTAGATAATQLFHRIEGVRRLSGKTVTISFYANAGAAGLKLGVSLNQNFGTGGSPSASVSGVGQAVALATGWARYSLTFAIASTASATLGTAGNDFTALALWFSSGANNNTNAGGIGVQSGTINVTGVQLEVGSVATPLEKRDPMLELALCQRMFFAFNAVAIGYSVGGNNVYGTYTLPVSLRAAPTVVISGQSYFNGSAFALYQSGNRAIAVQTTVTATGVASGGALVSLSADL